MKTRNLFVLAMLLLAAQFSTQTFAAKGGKPPPGPVTAGDVVCDGCVGTTDIEDGSVTEQKLSTDVNTLLESISELEARLDALEARVFVGDTGPAGGIVFYVDATAKHGMEAAPVDLENAQWGCYGTILDGADGVAIGTGVQNTADIISNCADTNTAARLAVDYELNGYDDWFLPSKDELNQMYLYKNLVGGFADGVYWSSSEYDSNIAWYRDFGTGLIDGGSKYFAHRVRVIRAF